MEPKDHVIPSHSWDPRSILGPDHLGTPASLITVMPKKHRVAEKAMVGQGSNMWPRKQQLAMEAMGGQRSTGWPKKHRVAMEAMGGQGNAGRPQKQHVAKEVTRG